MTAGSPAAARYRDLLHDARLTLDQLITVERRYLERQPYRLAHRYDARGGRYMIRVHVMTSLPAELPVLAGQALRGASASLDALAAALASGPASAGRSRPIRFPIHESLPEFAQRGRRAIGSMPEVAQATIEEVQPYHTFGGFAKDRLWLLRELGSTDVPALAAGALGARSELGVNTRRDVDVGDLRVAPAAFDDGAVVVNVAATVAGRDPKLDLYLRPSYEMAFAAAGPARGAPLVASIGAILDRVVQVATALAPAMSG